MPIRPGRKGRIGNPSYIHCGKLLCDLTQPNPAAMSRKRRRRTRQEPPAPVPAVPRASAVTAPASDVDAQADPRTSWAAVVSRYAGIVLSWCGTFVFVVLFAILGILRWRSAGHLADAAGCGTVRDVGGRWTALALVISSLALHGAAQEDAHGGRPGVGRLCLVCALLLALLALVQRALEYRQLYVDGFTPWDMRASVFDAADLYYAQAVKTRLNRLARSWRIGAPNDPDFAEADHRQLDVVTRLQTSMVGWTEQEVGHWLDDVPLRRELLEVMAFQIHPTAHRRDVARERVEVEQGDLSRRRQWLAALRDFCRQPPSADPRAQRTARNTAPVRRQPMALCRRGAPRRARCDDVGRATASN